MSQEISQKNIVPNFNGIPSFNKVKLTQTAKGVFYVDTLELSKEGGMREL